MGGTGAWATDKITSADIANNAVRSKHVKENAIKTAKIADRSVTAEKLAAGVNGFDGLQGDQGPPGQDATSLFAYVLDIGGAQEASIQYGNVVTAVNDPLGDNSYRLTFNRSLVNCVVQAVPGMATRRAAVMSKRGPSRPSRWKSGTPLRRASSSTDLMVQRPTQPSW